MSGGNIMFLCIAVGAFTLFGAVLAWACWMDAREQKRKLTGTSSQTNLSEKTNSVGRIPSASAMPKVVHRPF